MNKKSVVAATMLVAGLTIGSAIMESAYAFGPRVFSVTRVAQWDKLNVREEPGVSSEVIGKIPANGKDVVILGDKETVGGSTWVNVAWGPLKGWVSERYLTPSYLAKDGKADKADKPKYRARVSKPELDDKDTVALECGGIKPFWNIDLTENNIQINIKDDHFDMPISSRKKSSLSEKSVIIKGRKRGDTVKLYLGKDNACKDGITDINYPYTVRAVINGKAAYSGCCNTVGE